MAINRTCDGATRRDFLRAGALGVGGLSLASYLRLSHAAEGEHRGAKAGIFVNLAGGPSHLDTFDLKPEASAEYRGSFNPIDTNVPGIRISEHLPNLAKCADKYAIVRGVSHTLAAHALGQEYVNTGSRPLASLEYPGYGAVFTKETTAPKELPPFVAIPNSPQRAGFLGIQYAPFNTNSTPRAGQPYSVRGITLTNSLTVEEIERRTSLLQKLDKTFAAAEKDDSLLTGLDRFGEQAHEILTSKAARDAFDVSKESPAFAEKFGTDSFGLSCLLAVRLVEAGVKFVTINLGGWDTHQDNWTRLKDNLLPKLDVGLAALFTGLEERGLLSETAVLATGEFGRTPKINTRSAEGGRDHYPRCMFMLTAGGRVRGGQVVGESDDNASMPRHEAITPDDVAATFYANLGIDPKLEYQTETGRPITLVRDGEVITQLFG